MRTSLARDFGVEVRWVEGRSRDTFENAQFSAPLLKAAGVSRIILVTDGTHAWRAAHEFAGTGLAVVPAPVGLWAPRETGMQRYLPSTAALNRSRSALYELLGDLVRRVLAALHLRRHTAWTTPGFYPPAWIGCAAYVLVLLGVAWVLSNGLVRLDAFDQGVLDAARVQGGEWWRAWTALTLHLDGPHLAANLGAGVWFGYLAGR